MGKPTPYLRASALPWMATTLLRLERSQDLRLDDAQLGSRVDTAKLRPSLDGSQLGEGRGAHLAASLLDPTDLGVGRLAAPEGNLLGEGIARQGLAGLASLRLGRGLDVAGGLDRFDRHRGGNGAVQH